ncbi:MAG TPA: hypothetical protein VK639_21105 [Terriglobales bacterium]|nr:hypothetical protein [Terriglobales bacterium]
MLVVQRMLINIASLGMLATESEAVPQRNELRSAEIAERGSQAHNGSGSRMRCKQAVTSASAERRGARAKGRRRLTKRVLVTAYWRRLVFDSKLG